MNEASVTQYILDTFDGIHLVNNWGDNFFFYNPSDEQPDKHYFATLKTADDDYDNLSNLNRPDVFRLNIGVSKGTYRSLFGTQTSPLVLRTSPLVAREDAEANHDFTALNQLLPHPVYGKQYWICILNPSDETFQRDIQPLLKEAYDLAVSKYNRQAARK